MTITPTFGSKCHRSLRRLRTPYDTSAPLNPSYSIYFLRITHWGYEYEQSYAFLPLLPLTISFLSCTVFAPLVPLIGYRAMLGLSGYVINNVTFVFAAINFYKLSVIILKDSDSALWASILFCFNPASVFYLAIYSESLYALFSIGGIYHLVTGGNSIAVLLLALSTCARSNGVLNAGYFCFQTLHQAYEALPRNQLIKGYLVYSFMFIKKVVQSEIIDLKLLPFLCKAMFSFFIDADGKMLAVQVLISGVLHCICIFTPFIAFQAYGYYNICLGHSLDEMRPWCKARLPLLYNYIQSHYWGVGFLRYFQLKQLPNFLLASPILSLALCSIVYYAKSRPEIFFSLGFLASVEEKNSSAVLLSLETVQRSSIARFPGKPSSKIQGHHNLRQRKHMTRGDPVALPLENDSLAKLGYLTVSCLPFILQLAFMAATAFFVMHVQVATGFLSASPPLYWFASKLMVQRKRWAYLIWAYSAAYILLGSLLFSNFYPFT
ncbi:hypothetical protein I3843_13G151600 [Carya illinoinensis]|nr:hypothetical protein I3843_13G151600 [Carya illinoinensis]